MPLKNPRWEKFCQAYARGETAGKADASYSAAGYRVSAGGAGGVAWRLLRRPDVSARIGELQAESARIDAEATAKAIERLAITKENVLAEMARIAFANMFDYLRVTETGDCIPDLARIDRDRGAAIVELTVFTEPGDDDTPRVRRIRIKLADKLGALLALGRHLGLFVERHHVEHDLQHLSDAELEARIAQLDREFAEAEARENGLPKPEPTEH